MSGLFGSLSIAMQSLMAQQGAIDITSENIANVNTPGYSREVPVLQEQPPIQYGSLDLGGGVSLNSVTSIRDNLLNLQIYQSTSQQGQLQAALTPAQQVQNLFSVTDNTGLQGALNNFFNSLSQLSTNPSDQVARQNVLDSAQTLASTFQSSSSQLSQVRQSVDQTVPQVVDQINQLTTQIAALNAQVSALQTSGQDGGVLQDQRDQLITQLSGLIGVSVINSGTGNLTITTTNGTALVVGNQNFSLGTQADPTTGMQHVTAQGVDITGALQGGQLAGDIQVRDQFIPAVQSNLDNLAANFTQAFNAQHQAGFDLSGAPGGNFFVPFVPATPNSNAGAAAAFAVAISDPSKIAASSDGTAGDNGNLAALQAIQNQPVVSNQSPMDFYANMVSQVGNQINTTNSELTAQNLALTQLQNQQSSTSGVVLDEEATNLIRYQRAYEAAARVVTVINDLSQTAVNLGM